MGLNGSFAEGMAALDNCASDGCSANGCSAGCSTTNGYFLSYAHHTVCGGSTKCTKQTSLPQGTGCGTTYSIANYCTTRTLSAKLFECGPDPATKSTGQCNNTPKPVIACLTTKTAAYLCNCNPLIYGFIEVYIT